MANGHYFFALSLPKELKEDLKIVSELVKQNYPFKNWVHDEDYHITLAFLGRADETSLQESIERMAVDVEKFSHFSIKVNGLGIFGRTFAPRILWAGTEHSAPLIELQKIVAHSCSQAGFKLDERPFKPHITMARKWIAEQDFMLEELKKVGAGYLGEKEYTASEVVLYETHLDRIPKYEVVHSLKLL